MGQKLIRTCLTYNEVVTVIGAGLSWVGIYDSRDLDLELERVKWDLTW